MPPYPRVLRQNVILYYSAYIPALGLFLIVVSTFIHPQEYKGISLIGFLTGVGAAFSIPLAILFGYIEFPEKKKDKVKSESQEESSSNNYQNLDNLVKTALADGQLSEIEIASIEFQRKHKNIPKEDLEKILYRHYENAAKNILDEIKRNQSFSLEQEEKLNKIAARFRVIPKIDEFRIFRHFWEYTEKKYLYLMRSQFLCG